MAHEVRTFEYGREPWFVDGQGATVRVDEEGFDAALLTEKGILVGVAVWEGDDQDRPGQRQVGLSELIPIPFSVGPDPTISEDVVADEVQAKGLAVRAAALLIRPGATFRPRGAS
jgi:hypothetical protein